MKTRIFSYLIILGMSLALFACSPEFIEIPTQGEYDTETLANKDGVEAALISAYSMLDGWNNDWENLSSPWAAAGSNWIWGSVVSDDAYKGSTPSTEVNIAAIELFQWSPDNPYLNIKFKALYEAISRTNTAKKLLAEATEISPEDRVNLDGEILFLRAHFHFEAYKLWGYIPYYTEEDGFDIKTNQQNPLPAIIADLETAVLNLPEDQESIGRISQAGARAYLGKVLLYDQQFGKAKVQFDEVVMSGKYAMQDCFHDIFTTDGENGQEMIFSIQASVNDGTQGGENGNFPDRMNFPAGGSPFLCCGFHQPSQNLVNAHKVDNNGLPLLDDFNATDLLPGNFVDPRLDWTVGRNDVPYLDWGTHETNWIHDSQYSGPFSPKKFAHKNGEESTSGWLNKQLSPVNIPILRYADVLLMLAECEVELGNLTQARSLVNQIRSRANGCAQGPNGSATQINDPNITWAKYKIGTYDLPWTNTEKARMAVRMERRIELALEGHRFFDLRRWGIAKEVMNEYLIQEELKRTYLVESNDYQDKHDWYPIPQEQITLSKINGESVLNQNQGW